MMPGCRVIAGYNPADNPDSGPEISTDTTPDTTPDTSSDVQPDATQDSTANPCVPNPCQNGGTCTPFQGDGGQTLQCTCTGNWDPAEQCGQCLPNFAGSTCNACAACYAGLPSCLPAAVSAGTVSLSCIPTSVGTCQNGSTITVQFPYANAASFTNSVKHTGGQAIGLGVITPNAGQLSCNGTLTLTWELPGSSGGDTTSLLLSVTFTGKGGDTAVATANLITVK